MTPVEEPAMRRIYLSPPDVGIEEREALLAAFDSGWIAPVGPELEAFEKAMVASVGTGYAVALSSGTAALHLALVLLGVGAGDEVVVPTLTFTATANAVRYVSAVPTFVDVDRFWNLDPDLVEEHLAESARRGRLPAAVISVDLFGQCANYGALRKVCSSYGVPIVQDAAESLGAFWGGEPAGRQGDMAALSFNGNKVITTGGGGMLLSDRADWVERALFLATQAREPAAHYEHSVLGYNYRMSNLLAALGRAQLQKLPQRVAARRRVFEFYERSLSQLNGWQFMPEAPWGRCSRWLSTATIDPQRGAADRETVRIALEQANIESRPVWKPLHLQPLYAGCRVIGGSRAVHIFETGICLPSGSGLSQVSLNRIAEVILGIGGAGD